MGVLEDKLLDLSSRDSSVAAALEAAGALVKEAGKPDILDLKKVEDSLIAKAKAHVYAELKVPKPFVYEGHTITVVSLSLDGNGLRVDLEADCPTEGPYFFVNPPLQVVVTEAVMDEAEPFTVKEPCVAVDAPDDVLQTIIGQAVHVVAVQKGWKSK